MTFYGHTDPRLRRQYQILRAYGFVKEHNGLYADVPVDTSSIGVIVGRIRSDFAVPEGQAIPVNYVLVPEYDNHAKTPYANDLAVARNVGTGNIEILLNIGMNNDAYTAARKLLQKKHLIGK